MIFLLIFCLTGGGGRGVGNNFIQEAFHGRHTGDEKVGVVEIGRREKNQSE